MSEKVSLQSNEKNQRIILHPSFLSHFGIVVALIVSLIGYIYTTVNYQWSVQEINFFGFSFSLPLMGIFPIMFLVILLVKHFNYKYVISSDHVRTLSGILSLRMLDKRIDMHHIRGVEIERSIFDRIFNVGDLEIGSVNQGHDNLIMYGLYKPEKYRKLIESRIITINNQIESQLETQEE